MGFFVIGLVFQNGAEDIKKHRWFKTVDWDAVPLRKLKVSAARHRGRLPLLQRTSGRGGIKVHLNVSFLQPPIIPKVSHEGDTSNFDVYPEEDWKKDPPVAPKDLEIFDNFWLHGLLTPWELVNFFFFSLIYQTGGVTDDRCTELPRYQYCGLYHIAECLAFYTFIYDASQTCLKILISFPEPSYAKTTKKKTVTFYVKIRCYYGSFYILFILYVFFKVIFYATPVHWWKRCLTPHFDRYS